MQLRRYPESFKAKIVDLRNDGHRVSELAKIFEISESSIYRWVKTLRSAEPENLLECKLMLEALIELNKRQKVLENMSLKIKKNFIIDLEHPLLI